MANGLSHASGKVDACQWQGHGYLSVARCPGLRLPISFSWGSLTYMQEDTRLRPDWAGTIHSGDPPYENRVPGDTKQSKKAVSGEVVQSLLTKVNSIIDTRPDACPRTIVSPKTATLVAR